MASSIHIAQLDTSDRHDWEVLARAYKQFYNTPTSDDQFEATWNKLIGSDALVDGLGAKIDGKLVGIAHYVFHTTVWAPVPATCRICLPCLQRAEKAWPAP